MLASAATAIAGFAVLIASDIQMLRDFGFVTVIDLAAALLGVLRGPARGAGLDRAAMRDRYSVIVGLLFLAVIVVATIQTIGGGGGGRERSASTASRHAGRCRSSRSRSPPASSKATPTSPRTTAKAPRVPCPEGARRSSACRIATAGALRVCDFFERPLVISFWFTKGR